MKYFFILGKNPKLSVAEIRAVVKNELQFGSTTTIAIVDYGTTELDALNLIKHLGGTIKIGKILGEIESLNDLSELVLEEIPRDKSKIYFGISNYANFSAQDVKRVAMEIKKILKKSGPTRWVTSKEKILSSVIVETNKLLIHGAEICLFKNGMVGKTLAVQEFEEFEKRDFGKPERDILRGMIPPKLAKIMINLSETDKSATILDPFCGTGTILIEAAVAGYKNLIGSDYDSKAINQASNNIHWTRENYELENTDVNLFISKAENLSKKLSSNSVDVIITEPYLGPLLKGKESKEQIKKIVKELNELYFNSFKEWKKILRKRAKVVMIFPVFKNNEVDIKNELKKIGYKKLNYENLIYERPGQKVKRRVDIFKKMR
ncbi:MAG: methyltransferase domain-containing protein [Patescibacteria group bacterium]|nr:methyltransferase domain-containing protein [Patescibacteria group bacterium]